MIEKNLPKLQKNILLKNFTTYKIGGPAKYFFVAKNKEDLLEALEFSKKNRLKIFILAGGSNVLVSDKGFNGLVIKMEIGGIEFLENKVSVGAGFLLSKFASETSKKGFPGFEWAIGIPGATVGGSVYGNAQAFGSRISDNIESVEAFDTKTLKFKKFSKKQCGFSLKKSLFKKNKNLTIISVEFNVQKGDEAKIKENSVKFLNYRRKNHPLNFPSAGSTFVNPEIKIRNKKILKNYPEIEEFNKLSAIPAGYLIEKAGLSGKKIGKAQISEKHSNFIINLGGAKAKDVLALIKLAQQKVKNIFGINLETEVQIIK
jgi:UDP-N-acetylmuramate dehydrogenase